MRAQIDCLISLVGKQPMPVLIPILQFRPRQNHLVATVETREYAGNICRAMRKLGQGGGTCDIREVPNTVHAYRAKETRDAVLNVARNSGCSSPAVNITGGTTLMACGALQACMEMHLPMIYVNTDEGLIIYLDAAGQETGAEAIKAPCSIGSYLTAHGIEANQDLWGKACAKDKEWVKPFVTVACELGDACSGSAELMDAIRRGYQPGENSGLAVVPNPEKETVRLANMLCEHGMLASVDDSSANLKAGLLTKDEAGKSAARTRDFLEGSWLELFVYASLQESGSFDEVQCNVKMKRSAASAKSSSSVRNELDVVAVKHSRLVAVSCKSRDFQKANEEQAKQPLYELDSLLQIDLMGLYAAKVLVTNQRALPESMIDRAVLSGIRVLRGDDFPDLLPHVLEIFEPSKPRTGRG